LQHHGRLYSVQTRFRTKAVTDIYWETVIIASEQRDFSAIARDSERVQPLAQQQHKEMIRSLKNGRFDQKIIQLLGTLEPPKKTEPPPERLGLNALLSVVRQQLPADEEAQNTIEHYRHRMTYQKKVFEASTRIYLEPKPLVITELFFQANVLTRSRFEGSAEQNELREKAQRMHQQLLRDLCAGKLDETIELLNALMGLNEGKG
jgi:hypothetical protein